MPKPGTPPKVTLSQGGTHGDPRLTSGQNTFAYNLAVQTGLDINVIAAWLLAEESGSAAASRQGEGNHDWLNIGHTDSANLGTSNNFWRDPVSASQATAAWMAGTFAIPGFGSASSGIKNILSTAGKDPGLQISAIANSGWASSGYNGGATLRALYQPGGLAQPAPGSGPIGAVAGAAAGFAVGDVPGAIVGGVLGETGILGSVGQGLLGLTGDVAGQLAVVALNVAKDMVVSIGDVVIRPFWHWNQRAIQYYGSQILSDTESRKHWTALPWTAVFWGFGYWLLWTDPNGGSLAPASVRRSRLAHHVRAAQALPARTDLIKPHKVKSKTPKKPKPVISRAPISQTGTMRTTRSMPVRVEHISGGTQDGGSVSRIRVERERTLRPEGNHQQRGQEQSTTSEPDSEHRGRGGSHGDSQSGAQTGPTTRGADGDTAGRRRVSSGDRSRGR